MCSYWLRTWRPIKKTPYVIFYCLSFKIILCILILCARTYRKRITDTHRRFSKPSAVRTWPTTRSCIVSRTSFYWQTSSKVSSTSALKNTSLIPPITSPRHPLVGRHVEDDRRQTETPNGHQYASVLRGRHSRRSFDHRQPLYKGKQPIHRKDKRKDTEGNNEGTLSANEC